MYQDLPRPTIFAHRGSNAHAPENTLAAFTLAVAQGAPAIELDAKLTADGEIVVFHDQKLDRTTDGSGRLLSQKLAALKELDAGSHFSTAFKGEKIPTLAEVFEAVGRLVFINIELTNYASPRDQLPDITAALVCKFGLQEWIGRKWVAYQALHPAVKDAKPDLIRKAHQRGHRVHVYTVNLRQDMLRLFKHGVDGIFTDDPPLAFDVLKQIGK
jgi:glycerophosphoryl diester phosphodiesterase